MAAFLLVVHFVLLLLFSGYTGNWRLFDSFWAGGAVISGALLFQNRPLRMHVLGFFLLPALVVLLIPQVWTHATFQTFSWWIISFFLLVFIPTCVDGESLSKTLFKVLRFCAAVLLALYVAQKFLGLKVHGFGILRSAEGQILLGALACTLLKPDESRPRRTFWLVLIFAGIYLNTSRSSLIGGGVILAGYCYFRGISRKIAGLAVAAALGLVFLLTFQRMDIDPHAELRPKIFLLASSIFSEFPWGAGPGSFLGESLGRNYSITDPRFLSQYAKVPDHAHNVFLQWAAEGGILGLSTALALILCACILLLEKRRGSCARKTSHWPVQAALIWCPAFVLELMWNITEKLSMIRWMGLVGMVVLTAEYSFVLIPRPKLLFRLAVILLGAGMIGVGLNDLWVRQSLREGLRQEQTGNFPEALESYEDASRRRPWDEQPLLHMAQVSLRLGRHDIAAASIEKALKLDQGQGESRYYGAFFYLEMSRLPGSNAQLHKSRCLMLSFNDLYPYEVPGLIVGTSWARSRAERVWRFRRSLSLEPRAARVYDEMSRIALEDGDMPRSEKFSRFARYIRDFYGPGISKNLTHYSSLDRNPSRYESRLIDNPNPL